MDKRKQVKPTDRIKSLRRQHKADKKGQRERLRERLGEAMAQVVALRTDEAEQKAFFKLAKEELPDSKLDLRKSLTAAVVSYVLCATSLKQEWKKARVLDYLYDTCRVSLTDISAEIKKRGGYEEIVKEAAKENPRRTKIEDAEKSISKISSAAKLAKQPPIKVQKLSEEDDWPDYSNSNDDMTTVLLELKRKALSKIMSAKSGRRMKLLCVRREHDFSTETVAMVDKVVHLKS